MLHSARESGSISSPQFSLLQYLKMTNPHPTGQNSMPKPQSILNCAPYFPGIGGGGGGGYIDRCIISVQRRKDSILFVLNVHAQIV